MTVLLRSKEGVDLDTFLTNHDVRGKNLLYLISNRITSDRHRFKVGKSYDGNSRLKSYRNSYGKASRTDKTAGAKVHYIEVVRPRPEGYQGKALVDVKEKFVKDALGPPVKYRGSEWMEATFEKAMRAFDAAPKTTQYKPVRETDRVPYCPKSCRRRPDGSKTQVVD